MLDPRIKSIVLTTVLLTAALAVGAADASGPRSDLQRVGAWAYGPSLAVDVDEARDLISLSAGGVVLILDGADPAERRHPDGRAGVGPVLRCG